jgi:hypothetical protein
MHMIVLWTLVGAPLAMLGLSSPEVAERSCVFVIHPQITSETLKGREGQVVFPDRPTEYPCSFQKSKTGTAVAFTNQNGSRFVVRLAPNNEGTWSAAKDADSVSGRAVAPFRDWPPQPSRLSCSSVTTRSTLSLLLLMR